MMKEINKLVESELVFEEAPEQVELSSSVQKRQKPLLEQEEELKIKKPQEKKQQTVMDLPGVGAATAEKLENAGYKDLMGIAVASPGEIIEATEMKESAAKKIINAARKCMDMGFETGEEILAKRAIINKIRSGCDGFDNLLGGGIETGAITECYGEFGSGKTQIGHILCVKLLESDPDAIAVYIDSENTFRPERIQQLAEGAGINPDDALKRIMVARAYNSDHQMLLAEKVDELVRDKGLKVKLVVVDSLTSHFRAEFIGRGTLSERQQKLNKHMHILLKLSDTFNLAVYVTNQVMAKPDQFFGDPTTAIGGHIVAHASTFRIYLRKGRKGSRVAKLVDSPNLPEAETCFMVETGGIRDF